MCQVYGQIAQWLTLPGMRRHSYLRLPERNLCHQWHRACSV